MTVATRAAPTATTAMTFPLGRLRPVSMSPNLLLGRKLVPGTSHRLDQVESELRAQPPDAHVDHVGAGVEVVAPDRGQQLVLRHRVARVPHKLAEQEELQAGEGD